VILDRVDIGRLAIILKHPQHYIERRVETLELVTDHFYRVTVRQQFTLPFHNDPTDRAIRELFVPLGEFSKSRLPDLMVRGPDGSVLPLLSRHDRAKIVAIIFTVAWETLFFGDLKQRQSDDPELKQAETVWDLVYRGVALVVINPQMAAVEQVTQLYRALIEISRGSAAEPIRGGVRRLIASQQFWVDLLRLARSRSLIAQLCGRPGRTYVVETTYSERFDYTREGKTSLGDALLAWLGISSVSIYRRAANYEKAQSLWVIATLPEGVEPVRFFWNAERDLPCDPDGEAVDSDRAVVGHFTGAVDVSRHRDHADSDALPVDGIDGKLPLTSASVSGPDSGTVLDVQIGQSPTIVLSISLALFILFVSTYTYQRIPDLQANETTRNAVVAIAGLFSAIPAALAGGLAFRGQDFAVRMSRGPRILLTALACLTALLAAMVSLRDVGTLTEWTAFSTSVYCVLVIGVLGHIQLGPRWRIGERSRRPNKTDRASPAECQRWQRRHAYVFLGIWPMVPVRITRFAFHYQGLSRKYVEGLLVLVWLLDHRCCFLVRRTIPLGVEER